MTGADRQAEIETTVLAVLRELIGVESISPTDDFYAIGGHSLLIIRLVRKLERGHGIRLDPRQFGVNTQIVAIVAACVLVNDRT